MFDNIFWVDRVKFDLRNSRLMELFHKQKKFIKMKIEIKQFEKWRSDPKLFIKMDLSLKARNLHNIFVVSYPRFSYWIITLAVKEMYYHWTRELFKEMQILVVRKCISEILDQPRQSLFFILKICRETICFGSFFPSRNKNFRLERKQGVNIYFKVYVSMRNKKI